MRIRNQLPKGACWHCRGIRHDKLRLFSKAPAAHTGISLTLAVLIPHRDHYLCRLHSADTHNLNQPEER